MLHPSYTELMDKINKDVEPGEEPVVQSRYSVVIAAAKRARQLIAEEEKAPEPPVGVTKPLSTAVKELDNGDIKIMSNEEFEEEMEKLKAEADSEISYDETSDESDDSDAE